MREVTSFRVVLAGSSHSDEPPQIRRLCGFKLIEAAQDHAFAQRPRADVDRVDLAAGAAPPRPPPHRPAAGVPGSALTPSISATWRGGIMPDEAEHLAQPAARSGRAAPTAPAGTAPRRPAGPGCGTSSRWPPRRSQPDVGQLRHDRLELLLDVRLEVVDGPGRRRRRGVPVDAEPLPGEPAGAQRQRHRQVRRPRRCRPRSPASRRRCRAPAAARPTSRTSAGRPGRSARASSSPESTWSRTPVSSRTRASTSWRVRRVPDRRGGERQQVVGLSAGARWPGRRVRPRPARPRPPW